MTEKEKEKGHCATGPEQPQCTGPEAIRPRRAERRGRARFEPDRRGPCASEREGGEGEERLTGGGRLSSLTLRQRAGDLIGDVSGHGGVS